MILEALRWESKHAFTYDEQETISLFFSAKVLFLLHPSSFSLHVEEKKRKMNRENSKRKA